jgi:hypothetical protein
MTKWYRDIIGRFGVDLVVGGVKLPRKCFLRVKRKVRNCQERQQVCTGVQ